jgi:hypothetical protein
MAVGAESIDVAYCATMHAALSRTARAVTDISFAGTSLRPAVTAAAAGLGALAHFAVFATLKTPPYQWYYGPVVAGLTLCAATTAMVLPWRVLGYGTHLNGNCINLRL